MSACLIRLDNYQEQYYPGNQISGRVICSFTESENIRGKYKIKVYKGCFGITSEISKKLV